MVNVVFTTMKLVLHQFPKASSRNELAYSVLSPLLTRIIDGNNHSLHTLHTITHLGRLLKLRQIEPSALLPRIILPRIIHYISAHNIVLTQLG